MNQRIIAAWKPLAVFGLAFALAGCNKTATTGADGTTTVPGTAASSDTLAKVGDTPITRTDLNKFIEAQSGEQVLPVLIDTQLLFQAGKEAGIEVSDADIAAELDRQKKLDPQLTTALTKNPRLLDIVNPQIKRNLVTQRLLTQGVKDPTDAELQGFLNDYKAYYGDAAKIKFGRILTSTQARADAISRALQSKTKSFEALVAEQQKANDPAAQSSIATTPQFLPVDALPDLIGPDDAKAVERLPKGGNTIPLKLAAPPTAPANQTIYAIYHVTDRQEPAKVDFATLKPVLATDYKMAQVAKEVVKENPDNPPFDETLKRTRASLRNPQDPTANQPSMRDVLTYILRQRQQTILTALRGKGLVKIEDPTYALVADQYKAAPTPVPSGAPGAPGAPAPGVNAPATGNPAPGAPPANAPAANAPAAPAPVAPAPAANAAPAAP